MSTQTVNAYQQLMSMLDERKAPYRLVDHAPEGRTDAVSQLRGNALSQAAKCIVVMVKLGKKDKRYCIAVIPGDARLDLKAVQALFSGDYATFAPQEIAEQMTGCVAGTILPFSFREDLPVVVDPSLVANDEIVFNAARLDQSVWIKSSDYLAAASPRIAPIVQSGNVAANAGAIRNPKSEIENSEMIAYGKGKQMPRSLYKKRHSLAHIMAEAVLDFFPDARPTIGPPVENGFYYDFAVPRPFTPEDLDKIESRMREIVGKNVDFARREVSEAEARELFKDNPFKLELIDGLTKGADEYGDAPSDSSPAGGGAKGAVISVYTQDTFTDLCRGPHVDNTQEIEPASFKLSQSSGAYWRGNENNPMLQRIYGVAFSTKKELDDFIALQEEAKKRDHRKLGSELEIFLFDDEVGPGLPLWQPNGGVLIEQLEGLAKKMEMEAGYDRVKSPHLTKEDLFLRSGHLPYYAESMYPPMELDDGVKYYMKPMNCPFHHKIYAAKPRSYRDLPLRLAEYGTCYRFEQSGELFGLMRVRSMQMNDAHIYCTEEQFESEFLAVVQMYLRYFQIFGIDRYIMRLSLHADEGLGKKYVDNKPLWVKTEAMVRNAMVNGKVPFYEAENEAAFYGPKIDVQIFSAIGREFTLATNQVDFAVPPRFNLTYVDKAGQEQTPLCLHRAPLGTHERFIGFLIEHFAGAFPLWLAPVQAMIVPIADRHVEFAQQLKRRLAAEGLRVKVDDGPDRMQNKIRKAQMLKIPYMLVVGDKEQENDAVAVRLRTGEDLKAMPVAQFIARTKPLVEQYALTL
jgi:threonyl-tRNA synthetase